MKVSKIKKGYSRGFLVCIFLSTLASNSAPVWAGACVELGVDCRFNPRHHDRPKRDPSYGRGSSARDFGREYGSWGWKYAAVENWEEAEKWYRKAISYDPDESNYYLNLGWVLGNQGRWKEALYHLKYALARAPEDPVIHLDLGWVYSNLGDDKKAEAEYLRSLLLKPSYLKAKEGLIYTVDNQRKKALNRSFNAVLELSKPQQEGEEYRRYLAADPNSSAAYNNLGVALTNQGQLIEAAEAFKKAKELDPNDQLYNNNLSSVTSRFQYRQAYQQLLAAVKNSHNTAQGSTLEATKEGATICWDTSKECVAPMSLDPSVVDGRNQGPREEVPAAVEKDEEYSRHKAEKERLVEEVASDMVKLHRLKQGPTTPEQLVEIAKVRIKIGEKDQKIDYEKYRMEKRKKKIEERIHMKQ